MKDLIKDFESNNGWIPCSERLPDISNSYLVTIKSENDGEPIYETAHEIFWVSDNKWDCERDEDCEWKVTAWQNKLEPYKEGHTDEYIKGYNQGTIDRADEIQKAREYGYKMAINNFFDNLQEYETEDNWLRLKMSSIYEIAEQLKGGSDNGK